MRPNFWRKRLFGAAKNVCPSVRGGDGHDFYAAHPVNYLSKGNDLANFSERIITKEGKKEKRKGEKERRRRRRKKGIPPLRLPRMTNKNENEQHFSP
jgi:hypothetical protein